MIQNRRKNILLVHEGFDEKELFKNIFKCYPLDVSYEAYNYQTNIHIFANYLFANYLNENDFTIDDLDIIQVLKEYRYETVLEYKYTDILFVFDFDPHDPRFRIKTLEKMMNIFSESTNQGKLYLNYPMVESAIDFIQLPEPNYNQKFCNVSELKFNQYKNKVKKNSVLNSFAMIDNKRLPNILNHTVCKMKFLTNENADNYQRLLEIENALLENEQKISIINTSVLFLKDYNHEIFYQYIRNK